MKEADRLGKWMLRIATAILVVASITFAKPMPAFAGGSGEGSCTAGKDGNGVFKCCSCDVENSESRDYVVSGCELGSRRGFSSCQNGTDESVPRGSCGESCTLQGD